MPSSDLSFRFIFGVKTLPFILVGLGPTVARLRNSRSVSKKYRKGELGRGWKGDTPREARLGLKLLIWLGYTGLWVIAPKSPIGTSVLVRFCPDPRGNHGVARNHAVTLLDEPRRRHPKIDFGHIDQRKQVWRRPIDHESWVYEQVTAVLVLKNRHLFLPVEQVASPKRKQDLVSCNLRAGR